MTLHPLLGLFHTNLDSINKHFDDMQNILSCLKTKFDIIGITEHKIKEHNTSYFKYKLRWLPSINFRYF